MVYLVKNIACDSKYSIVSNIGPGLEAVAQKEESEGQWFVLQTPPPPGCVWKYPWIRFTDSHAGLLLCRRVNG